MDREFFAVVRGLVALRRFFTYAGCLYFFKLSGIIWDICIAWYHNRPAPCLSNREYDIMMFIIEMSAVYAFLSIHGPDKLLFYAKNDIDGLPEKK